MMVGYKLENTLTDNGHVARGVCVTDEEGFLKDINERTHIEKRDGGAAYTEMMVLHGQSFLWMLRCL